MLRSSLSSALATSSAMTLFSANAAASRLFSSARCCASSSSSSPPAASPKQQDPVAEEETSAARAAAKPAAAAASSRPPKASFSWRLPPGIEVYLSCIFVTCGCWYWLEAHYRSIDRRCERLEAGMTDRSKALSEAVAATENRWANDVRGKEALMEKVQAENVRLAQMLDKVTIWLRKCNVPLAQNSL